jgi:hypothetical protein
VAAGFDGCWLEMPADECWVWCGGLASESGSPLPKSLVAVRGRHRAPGKRATWVTKFVTTKADLEAAVKNAKANGADRVEVWVAEVQWRQEV